MGITGLIPFLEKASRRVNVDEFNGCTVAIDSYCWLHKGAFACAEKLVRGEETDIHIKYCLKYVSMLLAKNIKPILVFDGRHLPAKAMTEAKRRESRNTSKKRAAELLSLGQIEEARSYIRRSVDITHAMALSLIKECRKRNVDCIVAPYEADAQLAYLNIKNIAHLVITEDSDLTLFGCTKVLFKMDLEGNGILVETAKLPLVMKCPIERYSFDKFRQMCIMSGCDYLPSLPGIGLAKARQFVTATQDSHFANALRKLPSFFNKLGLVVTDEYRESFLKAEATFKHQYVYDAINRQMVRLNEPDDEDIELALCTNAGELLDPETALQLALGNLDPFTLKVMDDWNPDDRCVDNKIKTDTWKDKGVSSHATIWSAQYKVHLEEERPWQRRMRSVQPIIAAPRTRPRAKPVTMVAKYVPETQDESLTIESLSSMYCVGPATKKQKCHDNSQNYEVTDQDKAYTQDTIMRELSPQKEKSPILENRERSFKKALQKSSYSVLKRFSKFPRTVLDENVVASKFFSTKNVKEDREGYEESKIDVSEIIPNNKQAIDSQCSEIPDSQIDSGFSSSQKENSPNSSPVKTCKVEKSPILNATPNSKNPFRVRPLDHMKQPEVTDLIMSEDSVIENTYPMETLVTPVDSQVSFGASPPSPKKLDWRSARQITSQPSSQPVTSLNKTAKRATCRVPGLKRTASLPSNQPTLLSKFGFQKRPVMKR